MNILFLSYWGFNDDLTKATVIPHLKILEANVEVTRIIFCTIEREKNVRGGMQSGKIQHVPWISSSGYSSKLRDFTLLPRMLMKIIGNQNIRLMICRGTPAGAIGYLVYKKLKIDYAVESFEPHADYMREAGVWSAHGISYRLMRFWEEKQLQTARFILPVSRQYFDFLKKKAGGEGRILFMPCAVQGSSFTLDMDKRARVRKELGIAEDAVVGIYVGKFGGMYYDKEAFEIFRIAKKSLWKFYLIILTPDDRRFLESGLLKAGYLEGDFFINYVPHSQVPSYLSGSDFAFANYKPGNFTRYLSPVKVGEYWAAGLPVLIPEGIGDDYRIIESEKIGSVFRFNERQLEMAFVRLKAILSNGRINTNHRIQPVAEKYRSFRQSEKMYKTIIDALA